MSTMIINGNQPDSMRNIAMGLKKEIKSLEKKRKDLNRFLDIDAELEHLESIKEEGKKLKEASLVSLGKSIVLAKKKSDEIVLKAQEKADGIITQAEALLKTASKRNLLAEEAMMAAVKQKSDAHGDRMYADETERRLSAKIDLIKHKASELSDLMAELD